MAVTYQYQWPRSKIEPPLFYTYFYNHTHRLRLDKQSFLEVPAGILNHFWIQVAVSEAKRPLRNCFRIEAVTNLELLYATAIPQPTQVPARV
jgi:hypothetical protein